MSRDEIVKLIQAHRAQLDELGVASLALFGSAARGELRDRSDVDVLVQFEGRPTFDGFMDLKLLLEKILGRRVDLVTEAALRDEIRARVQQELLRVA